MLSNEELDLIEYFENTTNLPWQETKRQYRKLYKKDEIFYILQENRDKNNNIYEIELRNAVYETEKGEIEFFHYMINSTNYIRDQFCIYEFGNSNFSDDGYYKLVIPCENHRHNYYIFCNNPNFNYSAQLNHTVFFCLDFNIYEYCFKIFINTNFISIQSTNKINFDKFNDYAIQALLVYGFINGEVPMEKGYYFAYDNEKELKSGKFCKFKYSANLSNSYKNLIMMIYHGNPKMTKEAFEKMIENKISSEHLFGNAIDTIMLAHKISKGIATACLFATALEGLTAFIKKESKHENKEKNSDDKIIEEIKKEFNNIINNKIFNDENTKKILLKKVANISDTNQDKLTKTFEILNINLSENDKEIIKKRNPLLHGSFKFKGKELDEEITESLYLNFEFNLLCNALIYKYAFGKETDVELKNISYQHPKTKDLCKDLIETRFF